MNRRNQHAAPVHRPKLCEQLPGCMGFALSLREWGIAKLYLGNATLVPNDDWEIWQR